MSQKGPTPPSINPSIKPWLQLNIGFSTVAKLQLRPTYYRSLSIELQWQSLNFTTFAKPIIQRRKNMNIESEAKSLTKIAIREKINQFKCSKATPITKFQLS